jgi:hypothetical protein
LQSERLDIPWRDEGEHFMSKQLRVLALLAARLWPAAPVSMRRIFAKFGEATAVVAQITSDVPERRRQDGGGSGIRGSGDGF